MEATIPRIFFVLGLACILGTAAVAGIAIAAIFSSRRRRPRPVAPRSATSSSRRITAPRLPASKACPECGSELPADAPEGLCPQCLLKGVISSAHDAVRAAPAAGATAAYAGQSTAPAVAELAPLFPQLEILELIGQGGMGAVYKARQPTLDRFVAVKILPPEAGKDPAFAERFSREARALARLNHPNIVAIHDVGKTGDLYYLVMEYVDGVNLRQVLRDGQLQPEQALRIVPQICDALQYAHEEGIVHRDIKPENILLDRKGRVKIADFGLAKLLGRDTGDFTLTGSRQVMGTLYYMAPEQIERPTEVDHRADIYSLGVVFYEMLTGQLPVGHFPMPSEKAGTDAYLDEVVLHALEREPERRYQHASEVKTDVEAPGRRATTLEPRAGKHDPSEAVSQRMKAPAIGLIIVQALTLLQLLIVIAFSTQYIKVGNDYLLFLVISILGSVVLGPLIIIGAVNMLNLRSHAWATAAAVLAMLPCGPAWLIGLPAGIWALVVLSAPQVKAAFGRSVRERVE